jgi:hypothetical protein
MSDVDITIRLRNAAWGHHQKMRDEAADAIEALRAQVEEMNNQKDDAYEERNQVVAALARLFPSGLARTNIPGWSADWHGCVYIDLPTGQVSWHYHDSHSAFFAGLPPYAGSWDGHDTPQKYRRLAALSSFTSDESHG